MEDVSLLMLEMDRMVDGKALEARSTRSEVEMVRSDILGERLLDGRAQECVDAVTYMNKVEGKRWIRYTRRAELMMQKARANLRK